MPLSTYAGNETLDHWVKGAVAPAPAARWASLHDGNPGLTGANEINETGYGRVDVSALFADVASGKTIDNSGAITFGPATEDWAEATWFGIWDAETVGNFIAYDQLDDPKTVENGDSAEFAAGAFDVTIA